MHKKPNAFSLLEMLIVLAILGILSAIAYPSYSTYFLHQKRFAAKTALFKLASALENYFNAHDSYQQANLANLGFPSEIVDGSYRLEIRMLTNMQYVIAAVPINAQVVDTVCGGFSLNALGEKMFDGNGSHSDCW
jgi:type IV pilus assembly protein PilE